MLSALSINFQSKNQYTTGGNISLRHASPLLRQPAKDEVAFKSNRISSEFLDLCRKALDETFVSKIYHPSVIDKYKPITVLEKQTNGSTVPVEAFLAKVKFSDLDGLVIFSKEGWVLGSIRYLNSTEHQHTNHDLGKYMGLYDVNASYSDKYKGVGTALIQAAKEESERLGMDGQLKVCALNPYFTDVEKGSPVPFYAKMGFVSHTHPEKTKEELIAEYSSPESIFKGLDMFILTPENLERLKQMRAKKHTHT